MTLPPSDKIIFSAALDHKYLKAQQQQMKKLKSIKIKKYKPEMSRCREILSTIPRGWLEPRLIT